MHNRSFYTYSFLFILVFFSCDTSRVYEDYQDLDETFWHVDSIKKFTFTIEDADLKYNLLATFRNASSYPFYNLYYQYTITDSLDSVMLEELKEVHLFDPKTGEPYGSGLGDFFDHSFSLRQDYSFPEEGTYNIKLQQFMRIDTLPFIMSVGARVELRDPS